MAVTSVPIRTNAELRPSRLFSSMFGYVKKSMLTIGRAYMMYRPLFFFAILALIFCVGGGILGIRYIYYYIIGQGAGHIQSLILASMLIIIGVQAGVIGLLADVISANRKLIQDVQYSIRKMEYGKGHEEQKNGRDEDE